MKSTSYHYRTQRGIYRFPDGKIGPVIEIQARPPGSRAWATATINDVPLRFRSADTAARCLLWLQDPTGTEPEWSSEVIGAATNTERSGSANP
jgi:hypothetical protein